ncbi:hypothetical protein DPMN_139343 [Dreissena polymorpha]|uniref:Uncharacterized protein n=1 Tax=Dreissena polymorpha TaxID=45954 RepID=A0A9D4G8E1_DREPO|nr:hypothetical protein DPMN_139343 [Dreissena polymorpha]
MEAPQSSLEKGGTYQRLGRRPKRIFTPKERNSKTVTSSRTISLLNVEGKHILYHPCKKTHIFPDRQRIQSHHSVQKGGVSRFLRLHRAHQCYHTANK